MKSQIYQFFGKRSSIQRKVILVYLLLAVLPIILITLVSSCIYSKSILKGAYSLVEQNAGQHETVVRERLDSYVNVLYELVTDKDYINSAKNINEGDENSALVDEAHMGSLLRSHVYSYDAIRGIAFLADNGKYVAYTKWYGSPNEMIWSDTLQREKIYREIRQEQSLSFLAAVNLSKAGSDDDYVIMMGFPVRNLRTKEQSGVLVIALEDNMLLFEHDSTEDQINGLTTVILDGEDKIIAGADTSFINVNYGDYLKKNFGGSKRVKENRHRIKGTEWTIVNIIDTAVYTREINHFIWIVLILMITITCLFFLIVFFLSRRYIMAIQNIAQGIHNYEGTAAEQITADVDEQDELYVIVRQFNKMTARVHSLVETLKQRNEEIKAAAVSQKHAEIKALEAQINPHFLFNLLRCAWAGSQKYGALVWSGDIHSSFASLRNQLAAGLNMGMAGIPWWTTDIGGFHGGNPEDPAFRELLVRWFEYGTFCPVMRLHGYRQPVKEPMGTEGGAACVSGADNEVWSFGDEAYEICRTYLELREKMKPYIAGLMREAHEKGTPVMRPLFYDFPGDQRAWDTEDEYMFGPDVLVAPILYADERKRTVYLPEGEWKHYWTGRVYRGNAEAKVEAPLSELPVFVRNNRTF